MDQLKQPSQSHGFSPQSSSNLTAGTNGDDWQEEAYQKLKQMKEQYFAELSEWYHKIATKLQQHDSLPNQPKSKQLEKLRMFKTMLERLLAILQFPKNNITLALKDKMALYETWIMEFIETSRPRKPVSSLNNPPQPEMLSAHVLQQPKSETMDTSRPDWPEEVYQKGQQSQPFLSQTQHLTIQMQQLSLQEQSHLLLQDMPCYYKICSKGFNHCIQFVKTSHINLKEPFGRRHQIPQPRLDIHIGKKKPIKRSKS